MKEQLSQDVKPGEFDGDRLEPILQAFFIKQH